MSVSPFSSSRVLEKFADDVYVLDAQFTMAGSRVRSQIKVLGRNLLIHPSIHFLSRYPWSKDQRSGEPPPTEFLS